MGIDLVGDRGRCGLKWFADSCLSDADLTGYYYHQVFTFVAVSLIGACLVFLSIHVEQNAPFRMGNLYS